MKKFLVFGLGWGLFSLMLAPSVSAQSADFDLDAWLDAIFGVERSDPEPAQPAPQQNSQPSYYSHLQQHRLNLNHQHGYRNPGTTNPGSGSVSSDPSVEITTDENYRYIKSNAIPSHDTGTFPNRGNPNSISPQSLSYRVPLNPTYAATATEVRLPGVAINGVPFEPGTAEVVNGWRMEALQDYRSLGVDQNNAHVQPTGLYHYHGIPEGLVDELSDGSDLVLVGYAADGFPMYVSQGDVYDSSYQLKSGTRSGGPGGSYDGAFTDDFEYVAGSGDLDDCNGTTIDGSYAYLLTNDFPYIPRCLHGTPDPSFNKGRGGQGRPRGEFGQQGPQGGQGFGPPQQGNFGESRNFGPPQGSGFGSGDSDFGPGNFGDPSRQNFQRPPRPGGFGQPGSQGGFGSGQNFGPGGNSGQNFQQGPPRQGGFGRPPHRRGGFRFFGGFQ